MATWTSLTLRLAAHAAVRPMVAWDLIALLWAFRRRHWYRKPPFLPLPPAEYLEWRLYTAYGDECAVPPLDDVVRFARWRRHITRL